MSTIADFRLRVKAALGVDGVSTERGYEDTNLDQHIVEAVAVVSLYLPVETSADLTLTAGSRALSSGSLTRLLRVVAIEYPVGRWPRSMVEFDRWGTTLTLDVTPPAAPATVRVYFEQAHRVDALGSTVAPEHEHVVVEGAVALAVLARVAGAAKTFETAAAQPQTYQHLRLAQQRLETWRAQLRRLGGRVAQRRLAG
jgi:hypothetical protein